jgi:hypothetical protein
MQQTRIFVPTLLQLTIYNRKTSETFPSNTKSNSRIIMFMRYLNLAMLASTALSQSVPVSANSNDMARQLADFDWDIEPEDGFPIINFNDTNTESEVVFKFNYTGTLSGTKLLEVKLYQSDCETDADLSLAFVNTTSGDELDIDVDIIQETISNSGHYQDINATTAMIGFCLRVDYIYVDVGGNPESINFYETNVTITVDLTANFTLSGISADRTSADSEAADLKLDYPVEAYICLDDNSEVETPAALAQGSFLQVCVRIDGTVSTENIIVEDILTFVVSQPDGSASASETITNAVADPLTDKLCLENGICNVKTQLLSKFFVDTNPGNLQVDGVAILAFGKASLMPSSAPSAFGERRLRAPIRGLLSGDDVKAFMAAQQMNNNRDESGVSVVSVVAGSSQRMLQGADQSEFGLDVGLVGINGDFGDESSSSSGGGSAIAVATVLIFLAAGCGLGFFFFRRNRKEKDMSDLHSSGGTHPGHASVYSSSSSQQVSPHID